MLYSCLAASFGQQSCLDAGRARYCCLRKSAVLVWLCPFICFERDPTESVHTAHLREMRESFAATFSLSDTFSQRLNRKARANRYLRQSVIVLATL